MTEDHAKRQIGEWIVSATLAGAHEIAILAGIGERLNAAGISLVRVSVATDLLDPTFDGRGVRWLRDQGGLEETFERDAEGTIVSENFPQSPFGFLPRSGQPTPRRRLRPPVPPGGFGIPTRVHGPGGPGCGRQYLDNSCHPALEASPEQQAGRPDTRATRRAALAARGHDGPYAVVGRGVRHDLAAATRGRDGPRRRGGGLAGRL